MSWIVLVPIYERPQGGVEERVPSMDRHMGRSRAHSRVGETSSMWACEGSSFLRSLTRALNQALPQGRVSHRGQRTHLQKTSGSPRQSVVDVGTTRDE